MYQQNQVPCHAKSWYFLEVCEKHFFKVKLCSPSIAMYVCYVMGKFASSRREVIFFPLIALQYLPKLPTTCMRTADGSRGSASGLACFIIPDMLQASSCNTLWLSSAWKLPLHRCRNDTQLFASSIVFFLVSLHFSSLWMSDKTEKVLFFNTGGSSFHEILIILWHLALPKYA